MASTRNTIRLILFLVLIMTAAEVSADTPQKNIVDTAASDGSFNSLITAIKAAGLMNTLKGSGPFTVFAPTDEAFDKLPQGTLESLLRSENKKKLVEILTLHIVPSRLSAADVSGRAKISTIGSTDLLIANTSTGLKVDRANIVKSNILASNGVIHAIDRVLLPKNIIETVKLIGKFKILLAGAKATGLVESLKNPNADLTIFAPTDKAFAALPAGTIDNLLLPSNRKRLAKILKYHILPRPIFILSQSPKTFLGSRVMIRSTGPVKVNDANIILPDIKTTNGVIHIIDKVLLPKLPQTTSAQKAINVIELAIDRAVPLFNSNKIQRCLGIYETAARSLLRNHSDPLTPADRQLLQKALMEIKKNYNLSKKAWTLRYALDDVLKSLKQKK